jgi:hypothetical protein
MFQFKELIGIVVYGLEAVVVLVIITGVIVSSVHGFKRMQTYAHIKSRLKFYLLSILSSI